MEIKLYPEDLLVVDFLIFTFARLYLVLKSKNMLKNEHFEQKMLKIVQKNASRKANIYSDQK